MPEDSRRFIGNSGEVLRYRLRLVSVEMFRILGSLLPAFESSGVSTSITFRSVKNARISASSCALSSKANLEAQGRHGISPGITAWRPV
jgi:hypothetical protein